MTEKLTKINTLTDELTEKFCELVDVLDADPAYQRIQKLSFVARLTDTIFAQLDDDERHQING